MGQFSEHASVLNQWQPTTEGLHKFHSAVTAGALELLGGQSGRRTETTQDGGLYWGAVNNHRLKSAFVIKIRK